MSKLYSRDLLRFVFSPLAINFGVYYLQDFILRFFINYDQCRSQLYSLRESIGSGVFKHEDIKDWMYKAHRL